MAPDVPGQDLKIKTEDIKGLRLSYRWLAYTRKIAGGEIASDLPGTDQPDTVQKIYDAEYAWLKGNE